MDIDLIFKIAAIGIIVAVLNLLLKRAERDEQAMMTTLAGLIVVLLMIVRQIGNASGKDRIYIEDYACSFLENCRKEESLLPVRAALYGYALQKEADLRLKPSIIRTLPMNRDFRLQYLDLTGHMIQ